MTEPVPPRFRPALEDVVRRMADGDWDGLVRDGLAPGSKDGAELSHWVREYPGKLVPLPAEAWNLSEHGRIDVALNAWWVVVPLWTVEEGRSDLSLEATVREESDRVAVEIENIHVL